MPYYAIIESDCEGICGPLTVRVNNKVSAVSRVSAHCVTASHICQRQGFCHCAEDKGASDRGKSGFANS